MSTPRGPQTAQALPQPKPCGCGKCGRIVERSVKRGPPRKYHPECSFSEEKRRARDRLNAPSYEERCRRAAHRKETIAKRMAEIAERRKRNGSICGTCHGLNHRVPDGELCAECGLPSGTCMRDTATFIRNQALLKTGE